MAKVTVGLDLGFFSVKAVALLSDKEQFKLLSLGSTPSPLPGMVSDNETDLEAVAASIRKLFEVTRMDSRNVIAALPESKVFTRVIDDLPYLSDSELSSAIRYVAEEFIPMSLSDVNLNWQILVRSDPKAKNPRTVVLVIASPKKVVEKYIKVLQMAGIKPSALETETIAVSRSLVGNNPFSPTTMIMQMGATTTDFTVISKGLIWLTRSISTGGIALTRSLTQHFNFEMGQAEQYKKIYGLAEDALEGKVYEALKPIVDIIATEGKRVIQAFDSKYPQASVKRVVVSGGGAKMPGLVVYLANNLGLEVQEADPWYSIIADKNTGSSFAKDASFSVAVGLALREEL